MKNSFVALMAMWACLANTSTARSAIIYIADDQGDVVQYDTDTSVLAPVGNLAAFVVGRVMGLAYDPSTGNLVILDRNGYTVYSMVPETGAASVLFTTFIGPNAQPWEVREFQGGAIRDGLLYGMDEISQTIEAYSLETGIDQELSGSFATAHSHAVGTDITTGRLYSLGGAGVVQEVFADGSFGPVILTASNGAFYYDVDYLDGGFVGTMFGRGVDVIDPAGNVSVLISDTDLSAAGIGIGAGIAVSPPTTSSVAPLGRLATPRAFPNPFNSEVQVSFHINANATVSSRHHSVQANIYNASGRLVRTLHDSNAPAGTNVSVHWDGFDKNGAEVPTGIFFVRIRIDGSYDRSVKVVRVAN